MSMSIEAVPPAATANLDAWQRRVKLDARHVYRVDGKVVPGVTSIIKVLEKPALVRWMVKVQAEGTARVAFENRPAFGEPVEAYMVRLYGLCRELLEHERIAKEAADIGTAVHRLIEDEVRKMLGRPAEERPEVPEEALFRFAGWREWARSVDLRPVTAEARVYHETARYCGTLDLLAWARGELAVIDWKPTASLYPERRLQLAAYRCALVEAGWPPLAGYVVCLPKDGGDISMSSVDEGSSYEDARDAFLRCLELYRWLRSTERVA